MCGDYAESSGDLLPLSPPAEKATASQDQARMSGDAASRSTMPMSECGAAAPMKLEVGARAGGKQPSTDQASDDVGSAAGSKPTMMRTGRVG
jgi:hypothetical protein